MSGLEHRILRACDVRKKSMRIPRNCDKRRVGMLVAVVLCGIAVAASVVMISTHTDLRRGDVVERSLLRHELPDLANSITNVTRAFFDTYAVGIRLLAQREDWAELFAAASTDPENIHRIREQVAEVIQSENVAVVDLRLNRLYSSSTRGGEAWYQEVYSGDIPPNDRFTVDYGNQIDRYVGYINQLVSDERGTPIGLIGIAIDMESLASAVQNVMGRQDKIVLSRRTSGAPLFGINQQTLTRLGDTSMPENNVAAQDWEEFIASSYRSELDSRRNVTRITADSRYVVATAPLPVDDLSAHVFLSTSAQQDNRIAIAAIIALVVAYIAMVFSFTYHSGRRLRVLSEIRRNYEDLLSILGHNILNNVHSIRETIAKEPVDPTQLLPAVNDMEYVVRNSVYLSTIDEIEPPSEAYKTTIASVIERVERSCRPVAAAKDQRMVVNVENRQATVSVDGELLYHIFLNLVDNAIKYSSPERTVWLLDRVTDQYVECFIGDQGPGFSQEDVSLLYSKLQRLSARPTAGERSNGIGLYATKRLCDSNGIDLDLIQEIPSWSRAWVDDPVGAMWLVRIPLGGDATDG